MNKTYKKIDDKNVEISVMKEAKGRFTVAYMEKIRDNLKKDLLDIETDITEANKVLKEKIVEEDIKKEQ